MPFYVELSGDVPAETFAAGASCSRGFKAVLVVEREVPSAYLRAVVERLLEAGCRYLMAWGAGCELWAREFERCGASAGAVATRHAGESLSDVFRFARDIAEHPDADLPVEAILHVGDAERSDEFAERYLNA